LGYNPRSRIDWKGNRPSSRMGVIAMIRDNFIKARKIQNLLRIEKKVIDEIDPTTELFIDILSNKYKLMVHLHKEDDARILVQLVKEFGIKAIANHCLGIQREEVFAALKAVSIPVIYGPMDSFSNKIELKHDRWRNAEVLLKSKVRFSLMSDHPIILQRNIFYTLRHLLRLGLSKSNAISKITSESAGILGIENLGQIKEGFKASLIVWNGDPFSLTSYPILVVGEGKIVYKE
jgi:imidazolonepropionase-like amidohydrolase